MIFLKLMWTGFRGHQLVSTEDKGVGGLEKRDSSFLTLFFFSLELRGQRIGDRPRLQITYHTCKSLLRVYTAKRFFQWKYCSLTCVNDHSYLLSLSFSFLLSFFFHFFLEENLNLSPVELENISKGLLSSPYLLKFQWISTVPRKLRGSNIKYSAFFLIIKKKQTVVQERRKSKNNSGLALTRAFWVSRSIFFF